MNQKLNFEQKIPSSAPEIKETKLFLEAETNVERGKFITILKSSQLTQKKLIASIIVNVPIFQLSVNLNPQTAPAKCIVLIGKPIENSPRDRKVFLIPDKIANDLNKEHEIVVSWNNWIISSLEINGETMNEI